MQVVVTGATGFVGRQLVKALAEQGHVVSALTRDPTAARQALPALQAAHAWAGAGGVIPPDSISGADAVVHLAGESVAGRWTRARREAIYESRVAGTRRLVDAIGGASQRPGVLVSASAVGFYGDRGDEVLTEGSGPGEGFLADVCQSWEAEAQRAEARGLRVVRLRIGLVLGPEGGALARLLPLYRKGLGGRLGKGRQWWSWIHRTDLVRLIQFSLEHPVSGALNAVAPAPVTQRDFSRALARTLGRREFLPAPAFTLKLVLGGFSWELISSKRCQPEAAQQGGFTFTFEALEPALQDLVSRSV